MSVTLTNRPTANAATSIQSRIDSLVADYRSAPRGFAAAWCKAIDAQSVNREWWAQGYDGQASYNVPADVKTIAAAEAQLIAGEIRDSKESPKSEAVRHLVHELEVACAIGGIPHGEHAESITHHRAPVLAHGTDAANHYASADRAASNWSSAIGKTAGSFVLNDMSKYFHERHASLCPVAYDHSQVALLAGARASSIKAQAATALAKAARFMPADDASAVVEAFTKSSQRTLRGVTESQLQAIVSALVPKVEAGDVGAVSHFFSNFREGANHTEGFFANPSVRSNFFRGRYEQPLRDACAAKGLDYTRHNGIFDDAHFAA